MMYIYMHIMFVLNWEALLSSLKFSRHCLIMPDMQLGTTAVVSKEKGYKYVMCGYVNIM